jgi:hypothetical protein
MSMSNKQMTLLDLIYEHNFLNGLWFVFIEFMVVTLITTLVAFTSNRQHVYWLSIIAIGITANAVSMLYIVTKQLAMSDKSNSVFMNWSRRYRAWVKTEYPNLPVHTLILSVALIAPFVIPALVWTQNKKTSD